MITPQDYAVLSALVYNNVRGRDNKLPLRGWTELLYRAYPTMVSTASPPAPIQQGQVLQNHTAYSEAKSCTAHSGVKSRRTTFENSRPPPLCGTGLFR